MLCAIKLHPTYSNPYEGFLRDFRSGFTSSLTSFYDQESQVSQVLDLLHHTPLPTVGLASCAAPDITRLPFLSPRAVAQAT